MSDIGELAALASKCNHLESWTLVMTWLDSCSMTTDAIVSVLTSSGYNTAKRMTVCSPVQGNQKGGMITAYLMLVNACMYTCSNILL